MDKAIHVSGKRKTSVARATLGKGKGVVKINNKSLDVFSTELMRARIKEPLLLAGDLANKINIKINVFGGGISSQADAIRLAIGRALVAYSKDKQLEQTLLNYDRQLLVADVRRKETCKPNDSKARAKRQKSYR